MLKISIHKLKYLLLSPMLMEILLPSGIQSRFYLFSQSNLPIFLFDIIAIVYFLVYMCFVKWRKINNKITLSILILYLYFVISIALLKGTECIVYKFYYCLDFIYIGIILYFIRFSDKELKFIALVFKWIIYYLTICTVLTTFNIYSYETSDSATVGNLFQGSSPAGTSNLTGHLIFLLCVFCMHFQEHKKRPILVISGIGIFLTLCRGAILVYFSFLLFYVFFTLSKINFKKKIFYLLIFSSTFYVLADYLHIFEILETRQEVSMKYSKGDYSAGRFERWNAVFEKIDDTTKLLTGYSFGSTTMHRTEQGEVGKIQFSPHNVYIGIIAETGIFTLFLFFILQFFILKKAYKIDKLLFTGLFLFFCISYMTEIVTCLSTFSIFIWLIYYAYDSKGEYYSNKTIAK